MFREEQRRLHAVADIDGAHRSTVEDDLLVVAKGDETAFARVYDELSPSVFGLARRVVRDPARAEEITQDVFLSVWRLASRFDPARGSARTWVLTLTHRRAVDVVRAEEASARRDTKAAGHDTPFDSVSEHVETRLETQRVRHCFGTLTDLQREAVSLAYYGGYTYPEVSTLLQANLSTIKTRMRDGLIRLRDCLGGVR